ncbi:MAG TPA: N-6 DNA methylase, partial [Planctomycetota bacterium]|nr:N-6 DNA methylase [Planctomycetota bacterium]
MALVDPLDALNYRTSPNFLLPSDFHTAIDYSYIFRKAGQSCSLQGVYVLRGETRMPIIPLVYVCRAKSDQEADNVHRLVWNQNVVPFLLVQTPRKVRVYNGFSYQNEPCIHGGNRTQSAFPIDAPVDDVAERLSPLRAEAIDDGTIWRKWGDEVTPATRVDRELLANLRALDGSLCDERGLDPLDKQTSHALIGKFVYLRYLKDRGILSNRKLEKWEIDPNAVFSPDPLPSAFWKLMDRLEEWLNGSVFPLKPTCRVKACHLQRVAAILSGGQPSGQLHLGFERYDFSHIPVQMLSVLYQQFLHNPRTDGHAPEGKNVGAYYTPLPLVDFILNELDDQHTLSEGMKVLDTACGSGAFLVQCYRRLIERRCTATRQTSLCPSELRELLQQSIFGVERDGDACRVAELSLILTLLDYVVPPDLENTHNFKLPDLHNCNIFEADSFDPHSAWARDHNDSKFDWIVGNPPWISLKSDKIAPADKHVWEWIQKNRDEFPVGGNQVAEAFLWKALSFAKPDGVVGLLLPAMTLFKNESRSLRQKLFTKAAVWCVANLSNLAFVLFEGAKAPAAAFFFRRRLSSRNGNHNDTLEDMEDESILIYSPLLASQEFIRPSRANECQAAWNLPVNASEVREVPLASVATGAMLPWKLSMWGSHHDLRIFRKVGRQFRTLGEYAKKNGLMIHEGLQLRAEDSKEPVEFVEELVGKHRLAGVGRCGRLFAFPPQARVKIERKNAYTRKGRASLSIMVSKGPHIIVDAARRFSVFWQDFLVVPARYIGISGNEDKSRFLKILSLYLSSDFALYHQFLNCPQWGIDRALATLAALRELPVPIESIIEKDLKSWCQLHSELVRASKAGSSNCSLADKPNQNHMPELLLQLNRRVYDLLKLTDTERSIVDEFVNIRVGLNHGKVSEPSVAHPKEADTRRYLQTLKDQLDTFVSGQTGVQHEILAVYDRDSAVIRIDLKSKAHRPIPICL